MRRALGSLWVECPQVKSCGQTMARKLRIEYGGACYHVINRGNYRSDIFAGRAADSFQRCLFEACERFAWRVHGFVIMRNHFHLALETPEPNLSDGMRWLQSTWAIRFNRFRGEVGHPFQGRYKGIHVERGAPLARVANYIHLNPFCAGLVPLEQLCEYRWSSLPSFLDDHRPSFLESAVLLRESGECADSPEGWKQYRRYLRLLASDDPKVRDKVLDELSRGWAIGSAEFRLQLKEELERQAGTSERFALLGADREAQLQARSELWEERIQAVAKACAVDLQRLPSLKSAAEKLRVAAVMKRITSVSNRWLAQRLQMGSPTSVAPLIHRFHQSGEAETLAFQQILSRFSL